MVKKKILFISFRYPNGIKSGADFRLFYLLNEVINNFEVDWIASQNKNSSLTDSFFYQNSNVNFYPLEAIPNKTINLKKLKYYLQKTFFFFFGNKKHVQYLIYKNVKREINRSLKQNSYDAILLSYFAYDSFIKFLQKTYADVPIFIDTNDVQYSRYRQIYKQSSFLKFYLKQFSLLLFKIDEIRALKRADYVIALSSKDQAFFSKIKCKNVIFAAQGLPLKTNFNYDTQNSNIAFFGAMNSIANEKAAIFFKTNIFPKIKLKVKNAGYYIIGSNPSKKVLDLEDQDTKVTGYIEDITSIFSQVSCLVCPFQSSYGQRTRILEVMAFGVPCVVSSKAVEGMGLINGKGVFIEDDEELFAEKVIKLITDKTFRSIQSKKALNYIEENFSTKKSFHSLISTLNNL